MKIEIDEERWKKDRCWWCTVRSSRHALSDAGCHFGRKKKLNG